VKKGLYLIAFFIGFLLITGMGGLGGTPSGKIPTPEKDFSATLIDKQDVVTKCKQVSRDGDVFFLGKKGRGTVTIPFEKVKTAEFGNGKGVVTAVIKLIDGQTIEIEVDKSQRFYGNVNFGTFQIEVSDLKKIIFTH
jgi:ribosome maturation factor RimP